MYLKSCKVMQGNIANKQNYPFNIPSIRDLQELEFPTNVTFFVGENGSGKSTLLEAIADRCDFNTAGGGKQNTYEVHKAESALGEYLRLSWWPKISNGFFLRAETFYQFASHIDELEHPNKYGPYGGKSLHHQSHGESFLSLFMNRFKEKAIYILDEPEAALSPTRQLSLLKIMKDLEHEAQFIIATHSPILLGYPGATIYSFDDGEIEPIRYKESIHYIVTKRFLDAPETIFTELFKDEDKKF